MSRTINITAPVWREPPDKPETWSITLTTITPMFGGGAVPRDVGDPPIRAAAIRGHLRFWWRATAGARYPTSEELYRAESLIWGDTKSPGAVRVRVAMISLGERASVRDYVNPSPKSGPEAGYFIFPFDAGNDNPVADGRKNVSFNLFVTLSPQCERSEEVRNAIRAWLTFGGVGARTRRGCGALKCAEVGWLPASPTDPAFFGPVFAHAPRSESFPVLGGGRLFFDAPGRDGESCWKWLGRFWARFRKGHFTAKRPDYQPMSGGQWGDHGSLRNLRGNEVRLSKPFFGLPIIYQKFPGTFAGTLESETSGRMASPVILKPVAFADGTVRPMVACLNAPGPEAVKVGNRVVTLTVPDDDPVLQALNVSHPLDAVRAAARRAGFTEVSL